MMVDEVTRSKPVVTAGEHLTVGILQCFLNELWNIQINPFVGLRWTRTKLDKLNN